MASELGPVASAVEIAPVTPERWPDIVELFERPGPRGGTPIPGHCWCMPWRGRQPTSELRRQAMHDLIEDDQVPGLLAYVDGRPMGWVSVAPRREHSGAARSPVLRSRDGDDEVYLVTCFYLDPTVRGEGVSSALLDAAIDYARSRGAAAVEAFPKRGVAPHAEKSARAEQNFSFMGRRAAFEQHGFVKVREAGSHLVLRLDFGASGQSSGRQSRQSTRRSGPP